MVLSDLDRTLVTRCLNGTEGAWEDFIDRYLALITHVVAATATPRLGRLPDAWRDDLVADVLLSLVDQDFAILRRFRGQSSLGTYLVVVSRRIAIRRLATLRRSAPAATALPQEVAGDRSDEPRIDDEEEVRSLLSRMPEREAIAIRMFHLEHRTYSDIGLHFGIPENSVGPLLSQARDRLRALRQ